MDSKESGTLVIFVPYFSVSSLSPFFRPQSLSLKKCEVSRGESCLACLCRALSNLRTCNLSVGGDREVDRDFGLRFDRVSALEMRFEVPLLHGLFCGAGED